MNPPVTIKRGRERFYTLDRGDPHNVRGWCATQGIEVRSEWYGPDDEGIEIWDYKDRQGHKMWFELRWL